MACWVALALYLTFRTETEQQRVPTVYVLLDPLPRVKFLIRGCFSHPLGCPRKRCTTPNHPSWRTLPRSCSRWPALSPSSEYYLGTVPFKADPTASTLRVEFMSASGKDDISFIVDLKNKPFSTPMHVVEALNDEIQLKVDEICKKGPSTRTTRSSKPSMTVSYQYGKGTSHFSILFAKSTKQNLRLRLGRGDPTSILTKLGFAKALQVEPGQTVVGGEWKLGDGNEHGGRSIQDQRVRSDLAFATLREKFKEEFATKMKRRGCQREKVSKGKGQRNAVALHDGHLLVAEYLFSLVFLSMYRDKGRTTQISNAVELASGVNNDSVKIFTERLDLVCSFQAGPTGKTCSIKMVTDFVKKASFGYELAMLNPVMPLDIDHNPLCTKQACTQVL